MLPGFSFLPVSSPLPLRCQSKSSHTSTSKHKAVATETSRHESQSAERKNQQTLLLS